MTVIKERYPRTELERVRSLAAEYAEYARSQQMGERRKAWAEHHALNFTRPLIYIRAIPFYEFKEWDKSITCTDPLLRSLEAHFMRARYRRQLCDDYIEEPFMTVRAAVKSSPSGIWGMPTQLGERPMPGGAAAFAPAIIEESDIEKLRVAPHEIDEDETARRREMMAEVLCGIMDVYVDRQGVLCAMWENDISTSLAKLRGLEQIMFYAYDRPEWLHRLLSFMRDAILKNMDETEAAGDFLFLNHQNQAMPYLRGLLPPGGGQAKQSMLWGYMAAQEFTAFSPAMFKEFLFDYQKPILERYAAVAYGCCEDLTHKIPVIKQLRNLRRIAVSPFADLEKCAEQIGGEYILSWRPNPSDMVSRGVDEEYVRRYMRRGIEIMKRCGCKFDVTLKDVETVSGDETAIIRWTKIVREELDRA